MNEEIRCTKCNRHFMPSIKQSEFISKAKDKGMSFIMLECPLCKRSFSYNPISEKNDLEAKKIEKRITYRCPIAGCTGWVDYINPKKHDLKPFWGCGECGSIWYEIKNLYSEISNIIKKYPYREKCYNRIGEEWKPADVKCEPSDYMQLVENEPFGLSKSYVRG